MCHGEIEVNEVLHRIAFIEAALLLVAAAAYAAGSFVFLFIRKLDVHHWTVSAKLAICATGAVAYVVLANMLVMRPVPKLMMADLL